MATAKFVQDKEQLNLQLNSNGVWECRGRIQGDYPVYLPDIALFTTEVIKYAHEVTLHGGVSITMAKVREEFWVPPANDGEEDSQTLVWMQAFPSNAFESTTPWKSA